MGYLISVSLLWAFSFGLIKGRLAGLDSAFISAARLGLALVVFAPFLRLRGISRGTASALVAIGAVQFGVMYLAYNASFRYFPGGLNVALFTITTPLYVTLFADALNRRFHARAFCAAVLAIVGASFVVPKAMDSFFGIALVQLSNLAFAIGQVLYTRVQRARGGRDRDLFALLYVGGFAVALLAVLSRGETRWPSAGQWGTLAYLGVLASGVGFFLWNVGATRVSAGALAVMNNLKIPLAVAVSLLAFGEKAELIPLVGSLAVMAFAVWLAEERPAARVATPSS
jgi:drug/metabolite transporter (DMT)-like permease